MYMGKFGAPSPKPHIWFSNDADFLDRIAERAGSMSRAEMRACSTKITQKYVDTNGLPRCKGLKKELRESAFPVMDVFSMVA